MASKEYLKKYLSSDQTESKKKKRRKIKKHNNVIIHDDDVDWKTIVPKGEGSDQDEDPEDAPVVAEVYDEVGGKRDARWKQLDEIAADEFPQIVKTEPWSPPPMEDRHGRDNEGRERLAQQTRKRAATTRHDSPDLSPPRKGRRRHDSPLDISPPRARKGPTRHDSPDISPPRARKGPTSHNFPDMSPPRARKGPARHDSPPDMSPPRARKGPMRHDSPDISPPRARKGPTRHDSPDISPPRASKGPMRHDSPDISPPRARKGPTRHDSPDISPPRARKGPTRHDSPDISPPRARKGPTRHDSPDASRIAGKNRTSKDFDPPRKQKLPTTSADPLPHSNTRDTNDRSIHSMPDSDIMGKNAQTVYRDKQGRKVDPNATKVLSKEEEIKKMEEDEKFAQWGRGVAQVKSAQEKAANDIYEMSKPLARYRDDEDLEQYLKDREREGDTMLAYIKKKSKANLGRDGKPKKEKPIYRSNFPLNRYNIRPGYRWDGIDRSNGYEKMFFSKKAHSVAIKEDAYKWSVEDM